MAKKNYVSLENLKDFLESLKGAFAKSDHSHEIDDALSTTSTNPVQNKVLNAEFEAIATSFDVIEDAIDNKIQIIRLDEND